MSQNAVVKEVISPGVIRVSLMRQMKCGSDCDSCKICTSRPTDELLALAEDRFDSQVGDWVELDTNAGNAIGISLMVYFLPCLTLLFGYVMGRQLGLNEGQSLLPALIALLLGFVPAVLLDKKIRKKDTPEFTVSSRQRA